MAIYHTDFSEYGTGSQPSDWTEELNTSNGSITVRNDGDIGTNCLEIAHSAGGRYATSWDDVGDPTDVEVLAKVRITASYDHAGRLIVRGSGSDGNEVQYFCGIQPTTDTIFIHKYTPTSTSVGSASKTINTNTWYWLRFRVNGSSLKLKVWADGSSEPGSWDIEATDTSISGAGFVGVGGYDNGADVDYFAVGTGGESPTYGAQTVSLDKLSATGAAKDLSILGGETKVSLNKLGATGTPKDLSVLTGGVHVSVDKLGATLAAKDLSVDLGTIDLSALDVNNYKDNPHLLQHSSGRIFLHFDYMTAYENGSEINNIYTMYSDDNGDTWTGPVAVTSYSIAGGKGKNPTAAEGSDGNITLAFEEQNAAMYLNEELDGFPDTKSFRGGSVQYDPATNTLIHFDHPGDGNVCKIDTSAHTYEKYWDGSTSPALSPSPYALLRSQHPYYIFVNGDDGNNRSAVMVLNVETNTYKKYEGATAEGAQYAAANPTFIHGRPCQYDWDTYGSYLATIRTVDGVDRLYIAMASWYTQRHFLVGWIDLSEVPDPITGYYTWHEVYYSTGYIGDWSPSAGTFGPTEITDFFWISEIERWCLFSYEDPVEDQDERAGIILFDDDWNHVASYTYKTNSGMPVSGARRGVYVDGSIYFKFQYNASGSHPDRRGIGELDLLAEVVYYHEANWFSCSQNCGFANLYDMGDGRILMTSTKQGCEKGGVVIFNTDTKEWTVFNTNTTPGLLFSNTGNPTCDDDFDCDQWRYRWHGVAYDSVSKTIYACYDTQYFGHYGCGGSHGIIAFSEYGAFSTLQYLTITTPGETPSYGPIGDLSYYDFEYNPALVVDSDGYLWLTWDHMDDESEQDLMWANSMDDMELQDYLDISSDLVIEWDVQKINKLSFTLSHGHLLDPLNFSSLWHVYLKMGRLITLQLGENVSDTDYHQAQGEFIVKETSLTYGKDYPKIGVIAEDMRTLWEDARIVASEYFSGETPKTVIENLLVDHGGLEGADYDIPTFSGTHDLYHQFLDISLEEAIQLVLDHFGYFPFMNMEGEFEPRHIDFTDSVDHTYTGAEIIEYTPDSAYATFINRVIVTGMSNIFSEVLYEEESIKNVSGTIGWWGSDENITVYYSEDRQRTCRNPRLEIVQSVSEFQVWGIKGGGGEQISGTDEDEHYVIIIIDAPNMVGVLIGTIAALVALGAACTGCDGAVTGWCGACIFAAMTLLNIVLYILGAVASYSYNIWARPIGHERMTFQAQADDVEFQQQLNGKIITETIDDPFCYTITNCQNVADFELSVVMAQRRRLKFKKTAHLQDEIGDVLRINHPYSGETIDAYVTNLRRTVRFGDNAAMIDKIEGWRLI